MPILETVIARVLGDTAIGALKSGWTKVRRTKAARSLPPDPTVDDFVTGAAQAVMATRAAVEHFDRYGVLLDPVNFQLNEDSAEILREAQRTADEAEARLPRVQARFGPGAPLGREGEATVRALREAINNLRAYIQQPNEGEDWDVAPLDRAKVSLDAAIHHQRKALDAVSKLKR